MAADDHIECYHASTVPVKEYLEVIEGAGVRSERMVRAGPESNR